MSSIFNPAIPTLLLAISFAACTPTGKDSVSPRVARAQTGESANVTAGSGSTSKLLGRAAFGDPASRRSRSSE